MALTVDHGLRPGSAAEARQVGAWMAAHGIEHHVLKVAVERPTQAAAREARYAALTAWCRGHGVQYLLLGHHALDQAETVAIRHGRGSGREGLAGMSARVEREGVALLRPLLRIQPETLREYLRGLGQGWVEDPGNRNPRYDRARLRQGAFDREHWLAVQAEAAGERMAWERRIAAWMEAHAQTVSAIPPPACGGRAGGDANAPDRSGHPLPGLPPPAGGGMVVALAFRPQDLAAAEPELRWRLAREIVMGVGGLAMPPRTRKLRAFAQGLATEPGARRTLAGCVAVPWKGRMWICREPGRLPEAVTWNGGSAVRWGGVTFHPSLGEGQGGGSAIGGRRPTLPHPLPEGGVSIGALGEAGLALLKKAGVWRDGVMPREAWLGSPAVWAGNSLIESLIAAAHMGRGAAAGGARAGSQTACGRVVFPVERRS